MPSEKTQFARDDRFALHSDPNHPDYCYSEARRYLLIMLDKQPKRLVTWRDIAHRMRAHPRSWTVRELRDARANIENSGEFQIIETLYGYGPGRPTIRYGRLPDAELAS